MIVLFLAIVISGVKTGYVSLLMILLVYLLFFSSKVTVKYVFLALALLLAVYIGFMNLINEMVSLTLSHDKNIIIAHFLANPGKIYREYGILYFLFGGNIKMYEKIYSEVFAVTLIEYIGIVGLLVYFSPLLQIHKFFLQKRLAATSLMLLLHFYISLLHYRVYAVGVNLVMAAIPFAYFYDFLANKPSSRRRMSIRDLSIKGNIAVGFGADESTLA
jgi:uncharacterized protein with PQ loop repeat